MSYVQAAVYDAATKIGHRYVPYHHISVGAGNASIEAAFDGSLRRGDGDMKLVGRSHLNFVVELLAVRAGVRASHDQRLHLVD